MKYQPNPSIKLDVSSFSKHLFSFLLLFLSYTTANAQVWTWVSGDNTTNQGGVYGTKGTPDAANKPGCRLGQLGWKDATGNFWIFGGRNNASGFLNDLWTYNPGTSQWTWVSGDNTGNNTGNYGIKGTSTAINKPGGRHLHTGWIDASGNFWIFGGQGYDRVGNFGFLNDLWKYDPVTGQWTWVSGDDLMVNNGVYGTKGVANAANKPGARAYVSGWVDASGNFWIFGGYGRDGSGGSGYLNDLWKFDPITGEWTWVSGDNTVGSIGVYGTKGVADAANKPGGRHYQNGWVDGTGNIWIFGGFGLDVAGNLGYLNELWKYNPGTDEWTWISGDNTRNNAGVYGTKGTAAVTNKPGSRYGSGAVIDGAGNFWVLAGYGIDGAGALSWLNDLWLYNISTGEWTWHSGDNLGNSVGVYGTKGIGDAANKPGGRWGGATWLDAAGNLWTFGGVGSAYYNDLWEFTSLTILPIRPVSRPGASRNNNEEEAHINVYPNPASNGVTLQLTEKSMLNTIAKIYTVSGQLAGAVRITSLQQYIDLKRYPRGVLTLKLYNGNVFTIVKE